MASKEARKYLPVGKQEMLLMINIAGNEHRYIQQSRATCVTNEMEWNKSK